MREPSLGGCCNSLVCRVNACGSRYTEPLCKNFNCGPSLQLTNTWGQGEDKKSYDGRKDFALEHLYDIMESARAPLDHK